MQTLISASHYFGIELNGRQLEQYSLYHDELISWNRKLNLTSIISPAEIELKHFADSLSVLAVLEPETLQGKPEVIDIGTGAGFPGIPLKIALPHINLTLVDSTQKKMFFVEHVVKKLKLENVTLLAGRAEELAHKPLYRERFHLVFSRAVAKLPSLAELSLPFCAINGLFVAWKKGDISAEVESAGHSLNVLGARLKCVIPVTFPGLDDGRFLVITNKVSSTPPKYPRRPGTPLKNPL
jgi:16S rRNA (guanine527-N7)-methyltransferase